MSKNTSPDKCGFLHEDDETATQMHERIIELQDALQEIYARLPRATLEDLEARARKALRSKPAPTWRDS